MRLPRDANATWTTLWLVARVVEPLFARFHCEGREHVPLTGGCIITCNHIMGPDFIVVGYAAPRQVYYMAKSELFNIHPWLTALLRGAGAFPVRRGERDGDAIEQAVKMIQAGFVVGMFPEGTRSRTGALQRGRTGVARIALQANALVVPVVVINSEPVLRDVLKLRRRPQVTIRFGQPIRPAAALVGADAAPDAVQQFTTQIMLALAALLPPARHGYYGDPAADDGADPGEPLLPADSA